MKAQAHCGIDYPPRPAGNNWGALHSAAFDFEARRNFAVAVQPAPPVARVEWSDLLPPDAPAAMAVLPARRNCAAAAVLAEQNGSLGAGWPALAV